MNCALVTGASGFIGRRLAETLAKNGWTVVSAGRKSGDPRSIARHVEWSLGRRLGNALDGIDVVFHCASAAIVAKANVEEAMKLDLSGTRLLIEECRSVSAGRPTPLLFVFVSSQSSSPQARNAYGRSKYAIEQMLTEPNEVIVRPGLVYDAGAAGVYGMAVRLIRSVRVIPKLGTIRCIQPIHVDDLVSGMTRIADLRLNGIFCLGAETPLSFVAFCRRVAARENLPAPLFVPWSGAIVQGLLGLSARLGLFANLSERVEGLVVLKPMETGASLARLDMRLRDF